MDTILATEGIPTAPKLCLAIIGKHARDNGRGCTAGQHTIARRMAIDPRTVREHLAELRALGLVTARRRPAPSGRGRANDETIINLDALARFAPRSTGEKYPVESDDQPEDVARLETDSSGRITSFNRKNRVVQAEELRRSSGTRPPDTSSKESIKSGFESVPPAPATASPPADKPNTGFLENESEPEPQTESRNPLALPPDWLVSDTATDYVARLLGMTAYPGETYPEFRPRLKRALDARSRVEPAARRLGPEFDRSREHYMRKHRKQGKPE